MSDQVMGIDYFSMATDAKDDDKIFELKARFAMPDGSDDYDHAAAWCAYGRFVELLAAIYHEGFAVELTRQKQLRLSQQLGMGTAELVRFAEVCVDVGLFDRRLWEERRVLTSKGIQRRYFHATRRRKGDIPKELLPLILLDRDGDAGDGAPECEHDAGTVQTSCEHDESAMCAAQQQIKEKNRKEKKRREEKSPRPKKGMRRASDLLDDGAGARDGPAYPLACMSLSAPEGMRFSDASGKSWDSPWDALVSRYNSATGGDGGAGEFARRVAAACPKGCGESPEQVEECFALLCEALEKFDPSRAASPAPLALRILEDRHGRAPGR